MCYLFTTSFNTSPESWIFWCDNFLLWVKINPALHQKKVYKFCMFCQNRCLALIQTLCLNNTIIGFRVTSLDWSVAPTLYHNDEIVQWCVWLFYQVRSTFQAQFNPVCITSCVCSPLSQHHNGLLNTCHL